MHEGKSDLAIEKKKKKKKGVVGKEGKRNGQWTGHGEKERVRPVIIPPSDHL